MESLITNETDEYLKQNIKNNKYKQKINKAISFNIVKNYCFELFYSNKDIEVIFEEMKKLFLTNKILIRPNRSYKRPSNEESRHVKAIRSSNHQRRTQKNVF